MNLDMRRMALFALLPAAVVVASCGDVLDFRNAELSNGKIYAGGENNPFTGQVTNVPDSKVLMNQPAIRLFFQPLRALYLAKDAHMLDRVLMPSSLCNVTVVKGVLDGEAVCNFPQADAKRFEMSFSDGSLDGKITFYGLPPENAPVIKAKLKNGVLDGPLEVFSPKTQKLVHRQHLTNGVNQGEEVAWDEDTGNEIGRGTYVDGKLEGQVLRYAPDGKALIYRASFAAGLPNGTVEAWDPSTGVLTEKSEWHAGVRNGQWKKWDAAGKLLLDKVYQNGQETAGASLPQDMSDQAAQACVQRWTEAYRKEAGPDAMVKGDQLDEWDSWCRSGKTPG